MAFYVTEVFQPAVDLFTNTMTMRGVNKVVLTKHNVGLLGLGIDIYIQNQPPPPRYLTKMCHKNHKQIKLLILIQIQALVLKLPETLFAAIKPVYALLQELVHPRFRHKFLRNNQFRTYNKRNSHALHFCRTNTKEFSVFFRGPKFYNSLDSETIKTNSIYIFKKTLNT